MEVTTDSQAAVIDVLTQVAENVAQAWGTDQTRTLAELKELLAGLRKTSKDARDLCNLLVQGVQLVLPNTEEATKQRVLGLKNFKQLKTLILAARGDGLEYGEPYRPNTQQLTTFVDYWLDCVKAEVLSLTLKYCKLTDRDMHGIAAGMRQLRDITFEFCQAANPVSLEPLAACSQLHSALVKQTDHDRLNDISILAGLACVSSLRSLIIDWEWHGNAPTLNCACLGGMTQLTRLELQLNRADIRNERVLAHLSNLEELVLQCWHQGDDDSRFDDLAAVLPVLHKIRKLWLDTLNRQIWYALRSTRVEDLGCSTLDLSAQDLPLPLIPTLQSVTLPSVDDVDAPATVLVGLISAIPANAVLHLTDGGAAWHFMDSSTDIQQAEQLAEHLQSARQLTQAGRLTGKQFEPKFRIEGWMPPGNWPQMRHVGTVHISTAPPPIEGSWSVGDFAAVFPDVTRLQMYEWRWDVRHFLKELHEAMPGLNSFDVWQCEGVAGGWGWVKLSRADIVQLTSVANM